MKTLKEKRKKELLEFLDKEVYTCSVCKKKDWRSNMKQIIGVGFYGCFCKNCWKNIKKEIKKTN